MLKDKGRDPRPIPPDYPLEQPVTGEVASGFDTPAGLLETAREAFANNNQTNFETIKDWWGTAEADSGELWSEVDRAKIRDQLNYGDGLFTQRRLANQEELDNEQSGALIEFAKQQTQESLGAIDGYVLADLIPRVHISRTEAVAIVELASQNKLPIANCQQFIDRIVKFYPLDTKELELLTMNDQFGYNLMKSRSIPDKSRKDWPPLDRLSHLFYDWKRDGAKIIQEDQVDNLEGYTPSPEIEWLATNLDLTEAGRTILFNTKPIVHDLASPELSLGLELDQQSFDSYAQLSSREQLCYLRELRPQLNQDVLNAAHLYRQGDLAPTGGRYYSKENRIHIIKRPFNQPDDILATMGHELIHAADYTPDLETYQRFMGQLVAHLQTICESPEGLAGLPEYVIDGIVFSINSQDELVSDYSRPDLHLAQSVNQVVWDKGTPRVPILQQDIVNLVMARRIQGFWSEATAYIGMGVTNLPAELEDYYAHVFKDRPSTAERVSLVAEQPGLGVAVEPDVKGWLQQLVKSQAEMKAIAVETPKRTSHENYRLAADRVVSQCQNLLALRQQLAVEPAQGTESATGPDAQVRYLDNLAQYALHQALNYLCDINPKHPSSVLPAAA